MEGQLISSRVKLYISGGHRWRLGLGLICFCHQPAVCFEQSKNTYEHRELPMHLLKLEGSERSSLRTGV